MPRKTVAQWLEWQESLSSHEIDLGLERVRKLVVTLGLDRANCSTFIIGGTNGKGSSAVYLEQVLRANDFRTGCYLSPHLVRYNERIRIDGVEVDDAALLAAFEAVEAARDGEHLTYFEFGTLAAAWLFAERKCAVWILEVGLGGRLDAVNAFEPDVSVLTSVALDHQEWLGDTIADIAREKAGIMRSGRPVVFSGGDGLEMIRAEADRQGAELHCLEESFSYSATADSWSWTGRTTTVSQLPLPEPASAAQLRNRSVVLAAVECFDPGLLENQTVLRSARADWVPPGRCQIVQGEHQWVLDVAHNPQAAEELVARLQELAPVPSQTTVVGMMSDKQIVDFARPLLVSTERWVTCSAGLQRSCAASELADLLKTAGARDVEVRGEVAAALEYAQKCTPHGGRILVCGSFPIVGAALRWLGL
ncbi:MAG: bifunctional folylpolyglutamate synthase/dihydrofolate synthase [Gammaproteobacteria bacterium]